MEVKVFLTSSSSFSLPNESPSTLIFAEQYELSVVASASMHYNGTAIYGELQGPVIAAHVSALARHSSHHPMTSCIFDRSVDEDWRRTGRPAALLFLLLLMKGGQVLNWSAGEY